MLQVFDEPLAWKIMNQINDHGAFWVLNIILHLDLQQEIFRDKELHHRSFLIHSMNSHFPNGAKYELNLISKDAMPKNISYGHDLSTLRHLLMYNA